MNCKLAELNFVIFYAWLKTLTELSPLLCAWKVVNDGSSVWSLDARVGAQDGVPEAGLTWLWCVGAISKFHSLTVCLSNKKENKILKSRWAQELISCQYFMIWLEENGFQHMYLSISMTEIDHLWEFIIQRKYVDYTLFIYLFLLFWSHYEVSHTSIHNTNFSLLLALLCYFGMLEDICVNPWNQKIKYALPTVPDSKVFDQKQTNKNLQFSSFQEQNYLKIHLSQITCSVASMSFCK